MAGRNKVRSKQREYQKHCRYYRLAGYINGPQGNWISNETGGAEGVVGKKRHYMTTRK